MGLWTAKLLQFFFCRGTSIQQGEEAWDNQVEGFWFSKWDGRWQAWEGGAAPSWAAQRPGKWRKAVLLCAGRFLLMGKLPREKHLLPGWGSCWGSGKGYRSPFHHCSQPPERGLWCASGTASLGCQKAWHQLCLLKAKRMSLGLWV